MLISVLPVVATCLIVRVCRSSHMDHPRRECHCLCLLKVRVNYAFQNTSEHQEARFPSLFVLSSPFSQGGKGVPGF